jgi:hypothetical protein
MKNSLALDVTLPRCFEEAWPEHKAACKEYAAARVHATRCTEVEAAAPLRGDAVVLQPVQQGPGWGLIVSAMAALCALGVFVYPRSSG